MKISNLLGTMACAYLLALSGCTLFQDKLLYYPEKAAVAKLSSAGLLPWPASEDFRGLAAEPAGALRGTAIVFHGNAGHAGHRRFYAAELGRLGFRVILAEYPGYGPRDGSLGESSLVADAEKTIALAHARYGAPLLVIGESLGAGVAAAASARQPDKVAGLWLITPWDSLTHVAGHHYPWLPVQWLLQDRYDSLSSLAAFSHPVLVAVAEQDTTIPTRFGMNLYDRLPGPKRLTMIRDAGHNDWAGQVDGSWWQEAVDYLLGRSGASL